MVALLVVALLVAMAAVSRSAAASAGDRASGPVPLGPSTGSYYNPVAPNVDRPAGGVPHFADAKGWYPGLELRGEDLFFRDIDASVVVPSKDNRRYTTRIVADGNPLTDLYGTDLGDGIVLGSGNPADGNPLDTPVEDLSLGVQFEVRRVAGNNRWVVVAVNAAKADNTP